MDIKRYTNSLAESWDQFVDSADNGHFMFKRAYMDYHMDRFHDHSLIFMEGQKILAVLPANEIERNLVSHQGLTFGGIVLGPKAYTEEVMTMFSKLREYMLTKDILGLVYKVMPMIYSLGTREESLYALTVNDAELIRRDISSVIDLRSGFKYRSTKKQNIKKGLKAGLTWEVLDELSELWKVISAVISKRHDSEPTHSLEEMTLLKSRFPENIKAYGVYENEVLLGGAILFIDREVVHTQYLAVNDEGRSIGALDYLLDALIARYKNEKHYFSFGISTEEQGRILNRGLIFQKEGFGARGLIHDFYRLDP